MSEQSNSRKPLEKVFLLGAGASVPAGIPAIKKMTTEFLKNKGRERRFTKTFSEIRHLPPSIHILTKVASEHFKKLDLEYLLRLILDLQDPKTRSLFESKYPQIKSITNEDLLEIKDLLESFIREKCENIKTVEYLWPLEQLANREKLHIFTLNYDGAIEIFCEKRGIEYTDGFDPRWNLKKFADEKFKICIYKLHGSLYWFRTANATVIKVPMKGLGISTMKYLTDETVSEMMIYPTVDKNLQSPIPHALFQKFIDKLNSSEICVIIGYSFRDTEIKDCIIESLSQNRRLWLIIVNPVASKLVQDIFKDHPDKLSRIMTKDISIEEAFSNVEFIQRLQTIEHIKLSERTLWEKQNMTTVRLDDDWDTILSLYLWEHHYERISWIMETLRSRDFIEIKKNDVNPLTIEELVGHLSLKFIIRYSKDKEKCNVWKKIFYEYCCALEYYFFHPNEHIIESYNPYDGLEGGGIAPFWYTRGYFSNFSEVINEFYDTLKELSRTRNASLKPRIEGLIKTLDFIMYNRDDKWTDFVQEYEAKNMGLEKWASKIIASF